MALVVGDPRGKSVRHAQRMLGLPVLHQFKSLVRAHLGGKLKAQIPDFLFKRDAGRVRHVRQTFTLEALAEYGCVDAWQRDEEKQQQDSSGAAQGQRQVHAG